jgi:UDP-N-acetylglucosamine 2-epimerase
MKILTILGARPQFIKGGSVSREIFKYKEKCYKYTPEHTKCLSEGNIPI